MPMPTSHAASHPSGPSRPHVCYFLFCSNKYGTERMAIATLEALRDEFDVSVISPPGDVQQWTSERAIPHQTFGSLREVAMMIWRLLGRHDRVGFISTTVKASFLFAALNLLRRRETIHLHVVHGSGSDSAFQHKHWLNHLPIAVLAVSGWVREQLIHHGVKPSKVIVAPNFISTSRAAELPFTPPRATASRAIVIGRLDASKRVDLLLDAMEQMPELRSLPVDVYGGGPLLEDYRKRAAQGQLPVTFHGFCDDVVQRLPQADLFIHTSSVEAAALVILEAMAVGVPVLLPDRGGVKEFIEPGVSGLIYKADDARALGEGILAARSLSAARRAQIAAAARRRVDEVYSQAAAGGLYRQLLTGLIRPAGADCSPRRDAIESLPSPARSH